jgi:hypothetical protein
MGRPDLRSLVEEFASRLEALIRQDMLARVGASLGTGARPHARAGATSGAAAASRRLQGRYIGALRSLKGDDRRRVQELARSRGAGAALKLAERIRAR